jgi:hypothetical protein
VKWVVDMHRNTHTRPDFCTDRIPGPLSQLPGLMIIYVGKDVAPDWYAKFPNEFQDPKGLLNSPYKVFTLDTDPKVVETLLRKVRGIWKQLDAGELPPRDYHHSPNRTAWACVDCPFRQECYANEAYFADAIPEDPARLTYRIEQLRQGSLAPSP